MIHLKLVLLDSHLDMAHSELCSLIAMVLVAPVQLLNTEDNVRAESETGTRDSAAPTLTCCRWAALRCALCIARKRRLVCRGFKLGANKFAPRDILPVPIKVRSVDLLHAPHMLWRYMWSWQQHIAVSSNTYNSATQSRVAHAGHRGGQRQ